MFNLERSFDNYLAFLNLEYDDEISAGGDYHNVIIEPGVEYYPNNNFDLLADVNFIWTQQSKGERTSEIRPGIGFRWNITKPENRFFFRLNPMLEYRFFFQQPGNANSARFWAALDARYSLNQPDYDHVNNLYVLVKGIGYLHGQDNITERFWNQYRIYVGPGYKLNNSWRFELIYIYQASKDNRLEERPDSKQHIININVTKLLIRKTTERR